MPLNLRPLAALLLAVASISASPAAAAGTEVRATVLSIGDGDTIRLACIDAHKIAQAPYGQQVGERSPELSPQVLEWIKQANAFESQGAYGKAAELMEKVLSWSEKALGGADHPNTATSLNNLALQYANQGAYAKAEPLLKRALAIREKALGPDHPDTVSTRDLLEQCRKALSNRDSGLP